MNELTFEEALRLGVEAHKAGKVQDADRYYTAILEMDPNHPDANHNMGVLAVGIGKLEVSLPFFERAISTNPKVEQFWLSLLDVLVRLERYDEANEVFGRAKSNDVDGDKLKNLSEKLRHFELNRDNSQKDLKAIISSI